MTARRDQSIGPARSSAIATTIHRPMGRHNARGFAPAKNQTNGDTLFDRRPKNAYFDP
jgi:hypothetical protein